MSINTRIALTILASTVTLAAAAPAAFALDGGTWYQGIHTDPGGTADAPAARHSMDVMQKKIVPSNPASIALALRGLPKY